jgi:hypothetical protein
VKRKEKRGDVIVLVQGKENILLTFRLSLPCTFLEICYMVSEYQHVTASISPFHPPKKRKDMRTVAISLLVK